MELQLQNNLKPGPNQAASVGHKSNPSADGADNGQTKDSFKEQLERQKISTENDNTKLNQQDSKAGTDSDVSDTEVQETAEQTADRLAAADVEAEENPLLLSDIDKKLFSISGQQATESPVEITSATSDIAALLPETGNALPLGEAVLPMLQSLAATQNNTDVEQALSVSSAESQSVEETMASVNKAQGQGMQAANTLPAAATQQNAADYLAANRTANNQDKSFLQNTPLTAEMTADEIIVQSARNQQIPLSTAITASLANQSEHLADISRQLSAAGFGQNSNLNNSQNNSLNNTTTLTSSLTSNLTGSLTGSITTHLQGPEWSRQMSDQVSVMIKGGFQQAEIKLNPQHLGPMEIKLSMTDDQASIQFVTHHAQVRDVIDAAMPRLRDMLEQQGINLADVDVSTQSEQRQSYDEATQSGAGQANAELSPDVTEIPNTERMVTIDIPQSSGVNIFA